MAGDLNMRWRTAIFLASLSAGAAAQSLVDPTRPPALAAVAPTPGAERALTAATAPVRPAAPQLQSIHLPRNGTASALVDGRVVRAGEQVGEHTVTAIDSTGITLRGARGDSRVLSLLNGVSKTPSSSPPDTSSKLAAGTRKENR